jgi:replicative DNA helicase
MRVEQLILKTLIESEDYLRKVLPFLKSDYFNGTEKTIFKVISDFASEYNSTPSYEAIRISIGEKKNVTSEEVENSEDYLLELSRIQNNNTNESWLSDKTEKFCQEKAIYNSVLQAITILDGKDKTHDKGSIPKLLSDALSVSFDNSVGHDYLENSDARYEFYHKVEERIPFDLDFFNKITKGGLPNKTLNIALAGTGVGKSLFMCHVASSCLVLGKNVLYVTLEMAEEKIAERIDANLLNVKVDELATLSKEAYDKKVAKVKSKTHGKLIIKEYPTASASTTHFRTLLNELHLKRNFRPDIIFIDYLNICTSSRIKPGNSINSYTYVKSIAEELRGLAVEYGVPIVSATQTTRSGFTSSDPGLEDTSESFGLPATADLMFALISSDELEELGQLMVKQLKNRYADPTYLKRFTIGVDRSKMRLYDVENSAQDDIADAGFKKFDETAKKKFEGFSV